MTEGNTIWDLNCDCTNIMDGKNSNHCSTGRHLFLMSVPVTVSHFYIVCMHKQVSPWTTEKKKVIELV